MARDHYQADSGRLLSAHLSSMALRHARWGGLTEADLGDLCGALAEQRELVLRGTGLGHGWAASPGAAIGLRHPGGDQADLGRYLR